MWDLDTVKRWGAQALFPASIDRWMWCRKELPPLVVHSAIGVGAAPTVQVDMQALANAFWPWVSGLERDRRFQSLDSLDFAHFAAGQLLCQLLRAQPLQLPTGQHHEAVFALSRTVVTLLAAWRQALGATPWAMQLPERHSAPWASYLENVAEDPAMATAFLDSFTGLEPVWRFPMMIRERPAMRRALKARHDGAQDGHPRRIGCGAARDAAA